MKSKDLQNWYFQGTKKLKGSSEIFRHLNGALCLRTVKRRWKMILKTDSVKLSVLSDCRLPIIRTKKWIKKVKDCLNRKKKVTSRKLAVQLNVSRTSLRRILQNDLPLRPLKKIVELLLIDEHKEKTQKCTKTISKRNDTMKILFLNEKLFDRDGIYNCQNDYIWAVDSVEADKRDGVKQK